MKKTKRSSRGRLLFYTRDSGGKHETTPGEYVRLAQGRAAGLGLTFAGTPALIDQMIRNESSHGDDLYLDFDVKGNSLTRPGLDALMERIETDFDVSHVFIPRRDRLARPDHAIDGVRLEVNIRRNGVSILFIGHEVGPLNVGSRDSLGELITTIIDYDKAGEDRRNLAEKILLAQLSLAKSGYSTGGRAPFGFRRCLVRVSDGEIARELDSGERVRMAGHHVIWMPYPDDHTDVQLIRRILTMLESMPASRVAAQLTSEGVKTPDFGRTRKDMGIYHETSGVWHANTVTNIARNPLLRAIVSYGRRSMGDQLRYEAEGPRAMTAEDYRDDGKPKVIRNAESSLLNAEAKFAPVVDVGRHEELLKSLDERGGTQRGKRRSRSHKANPLGGRVFDVNCKWPMYRVPRINGFFYTCALYMQSHGAACRHNQIDGQKLSNLVLDAMRQKLLAPSAQQKLKARIQELIAQDNVVDSGARQLADKESDLRQIEQKLKVACTNMTLATSERQLAAMSKVFDDLDVRRDELEAEIVDMRRQKERQGISGDDVNATLALFDRLPELVSNVDDLSAVSEGIGLADIRVYLGFRQEALKKRTVNRVAYASITFGAEEPPIEPYKGPTGRRALQENKTAAFAVGAEGEPLLPGPWVPIRRKSR